MAELLVGEKGLQDPGTLDLHDAALVAVTRIHHLRISNICLTGHPNAIPISTRRLRFASIPIGVAAVFIILERGENDWRSAGSLRIKGTVHRQLAALVELQNRARWYGKRCTTCNSHIVGNDIDSTILESNILVNCSTQDLWQSKLQGVFAYFHNSTIRALIFILYPFVLLVELITRAFPNNEDDPTVSREEVLAMVNVGEEEGVVDEDENKIFTNLMRLDSIHAYDVMTPRVVAKIAPENMTLRAYYDNDEYDHFSRIPLYKPEAPEYITGFILRNDALEDLTEDHFRKTLGGIKRPLPAFDQDLTLGVIFDSMLKQKSQIAQIIDEYGMFVGILTLEDIIETIFGLEIIDENDTVIDMQQYARERWEQRQKKYKRL